MADAVPTPGVRDVYQGLTWKNLLDDTLDQAGADAGDYTTEELARFERWMLEALEMIRAEVPEEDGVRSTTLVTNHPDTKYYLDYDVESIKYASAAGKPVLIFTREEYENELRKNDGSFPSGADLTMVLWEKHAGTRRWIVLLEGVTATATTIDIVYYPKPAVIADLAHLIPLPSLFHPPMRHAMRMKLHTRQEDWQAKEDAMRDLELSLSTARSRYRPNRTVRKAFRSSYAGRSSRSRNPGRRF
jgi:hypothetical protein